MEVVSLCALPAYGFEWQPSQGVFALTVVCKATYHLRPGRSVLAPEQEPILRADEHWNRDPSASLRAASDLAPYKRRADVVVVGHAYAPAQKPVRSFVARVVVGEVDKAIEVWCERAIRWRDGRLMEGPKIVKASLRWENAAGGSDLDNPVGVSFDGPLDAQGSLVVPCLQPPDTYVTTRGDVFAPVGFGPVAARWPARVRTLHRHARHILTEGWETQPLPSDFSYDFFCVAPPDQQQVAMLRPDERILLENLHPEHPRLVTSLPGILPRAIADRATGEREEIMLAADTLAIDTDRRICTLVWRGRIGLRHPGEAGRVAFWVDGEPVATTTESVDAHEQDGRDAADTGAGPDTVMLFPQATQVNTLPLPWVRDGAQLAADASQTMYSPPTVAKDPLPFAPALDGRPPAVAHSVSPWAKDPQPVDAAGTGTLMGALALDDGADLPFYGSPCGLPVRASAPSPAGVSAAASLHTGELSDEEHILPRAARTHSVSILNGYEDARALGFSPVSAPPMIGPLSTPEMISLGPPSLSASTDRLASTHDVVRAPQQGPPQDAGPTSEREVTLERWAALTARIALRASEKEKVLQQEEISFERWRAVGEHWNAAIREELRRGRTTLLDRSDVAYVAEIERQRGSLSIEHYAALSIAAERGRTQEVLAELELPPGALMRIERVWGKALTADLPLGERLSQQQAELRNRG